MNLLYLGAAETQGSARNLGKKRKGKESPKGKGGKGGKNLRKEGKEKGE
jgi:hypothetical protein